MMAFYLAAIGIGVAACRAGASCEDLPAGKVVPT
jgi:hypothetical protein